MKSTFEPLGKYIHDVDIRNTDMSVTKLMGVNLSKQMMPSVANIIGTDLSVYKIVKKRQFACKLMSVGRDACLPIALKLDDEPVIISSAYYAFEVNDENVMLPEYLMMCFLRPDFDRELWFRTGGDVRGGITWETFCNIKIPVLPYTDQLKIVQDYQVIINRTNLLKTINNNLEAQAFTLFEKVVRNCTDKQPLMKFGKVVTGKTPSTEISDYYGDDVPFIKTPDMHGNLYVVSWESSLSKYGADSQSNKYLPPNTVIVSCIGANAGEVSLTSCTAQTNQQINAVITDYPRFLYCALIKCRDELRALGDAGSTMININKSLFENYQIVCPKRDVLDMTEAELIPIFDSIKNNLKEMVVLEKLAHLVMNRLSMNN